jgi:dTMP kinase
MSQIMNKPKFISFEGTEGVGKTTVINEVANYLREQQIDFVQTREPGGSPFAETLRGLLLDPATIMSDASELLLMFAARADHIATVIQPALAQGQWVLCDRFIDSTVAYQGFGRNQGNSQALAQIALLVDNFVPTLPDVTIWLDLPVLEGMARAKNRGKLDRFEQEQIAFFERVHQGFAYQAQQQPERVKRIDASGDIDAVLARVLAQLAP